MAAVVVAGAAVLMMVVSEATVMGLAEVRCRHCRCPRGCCRCYERHDRSRSRRRSRSMSELLSCCCAVFVAVAAVVVVAAAAAAAAAAAGAGAAAAAAAAAAVATMIDHNHHPTVQYDPHEPTVPRQPASCRSPPHSSCQLIHRPALRQSRAAKVSPCRPAAGFLFQP